MSEETTGTSGGKPPPPQVLAALPMAPPRADEVTGIIDIPEHVEQAFLALPPEHRRRAQTRLENGLTVQQTLFAHAYARTFNGTLASKAAGYQGTDAAHAVTANRLLKHAKVRAYLDLVHRSLALTPPEIEHRVADVARSGPDRLLEVVRTAEEGQVSDALEVANSLGIGHLIKRLRKTRDGVDLQLHDSMAALRFGAELQGMMTQRVEVSGPGIDEQLATLLSQLGEEAVDAEFEEVSEDKDT